MNKIVMLALTAGICVVGLCLGASAPVVALRLYAAGASELQIGVFSALPALGMMVSAFGVGRWCQRFGKRPLYLASLLLSGLSIAALEWAGTQLGPLGLARLLMGLSTGVLIIVGEAWVSEMAPEASRGRVVAVYMTSFTAFQMLGPGLVSLLGTQGPWVLRVVVAAHVLAGVLIAATLPAQPATAEVEAERSFSVLGFVKVAPALCMGVVFFAFFDSMILSLFPVYAAAQGYPVALAALMVAVILLGDTVCQVPLGWLADRIGAPVVYLGCSLVALALALLLPWLMPQAWLVWPSLLVLGAVAGAVYTLAIILMGQRFSGPDLVTANASAGFLWGLGSVLGPLLSGAAMAQGPHGLPLALVGMAGLLVLGAAGLYRRQGRVAARV